MLRSWLATFTLGTLWQKVAMAKILFEQCHWDASKTSGKQGKGRQGENHLKLLYDMLECFYDIITDTQQS